MAGLLDYVMVKTHMVSSPEVSVQSKGIVVDKAVESKYRNHSAI